MALRPEVKILHIIAVCAHCEKPLWVPRAPSGSAAWEHPWTWLPDNNGDYSSWIT